MMNINFFADKFIPGDKFQIQKIGDSVKKHLSALKVGDSIMLLGADNDSLTFRHENRIYDVNKSFGFDLFVTI